MECNIDSRGRLWRIVLGIIIIFVGSALFVVNVSESTTAWRLFYGGIVFLGIFMIVEGAFGWCALRALLKKK